MSQAHTGHFAGLFAPSGGAGGRLPREAGEPEYFPDLLLDQLVDAVVTERDPHDLKAAFRTRLTDVSAIKLRQAVFADLENANLLTAVRAFCAGLVQCGHQWDVAARLRHRPQSQRWKLTAISTYVQVVDAVTAAVEDAGPSSPGMRAWLEWLEDYRGSPDFTRMAAGVEAALTELGSLRYTLSLSGDRITASPFAGQDDLGAATLATFDRFATGDVTPHRFDVRAGAEMNQMHEAVLDLVVQLFPDVFDRAARFLDEHAEVRHPVIDVVERELRFVLSWLDFTAAARQAGLPFGLPDVEHGRKLEVRDTFDALLVHTLVAAGRKPVVNDVALGDGEAVLVITGPNQGGKTTFARTLGQLYHLAALGVPVPGSFAALHPPDAILTHFERGDRAGEMTSRLEEEVTRMSDLLAEAGSRSVVVLNEMFSSTTHVDAQAISRDVLHAVLDTGAVGVCVTFVDELSRMDSRIVSLVAGVDERDASSRTFRVTRGRADGEAYALALAAQHGLDRDRLRARIEARA
ncbi:hypothetical protein [Lentzea sp. NPDC060358]|uniref:MutS-related protein n=1 Tax=Lentzea sp. NPDC060358 TaxID=3347103 RepID=UPI00365DA55C